MIDVFLHPSARKRADATRSVNRSAHRGNFCCATEGDSKRAWQKERERDAEKAELRSREMCVQEKGKVVASEFYFSPS